MFIMSIVISQREKHPFAKNFSTTRSLTPAAFAEASEAPEFFRSSLAADPDFASWVDFFGD